ncbi:hypothetical protein ACFYZH_20340 [Streptomyces abikoensis]|uniref:hypothetical protein n=1 Tax=Streptomyces abikoensis TaxID=97398 RepID=UPI003674A49D
MGIFDRFKSHRAERRTEAKTSGPASAPEGARHHTGGKDAVKMDENEWQVEERLRIEDDHNK